MKRLFDDAYAPLTYGIGFIEADLNVATGSLRETIVRSPFFVTRWLNNCFVRIEHLNLPLQEALLQLQPLSDVTDRHLLVRTKGNWLAYFSNTFGFYNKYGQIERLAADLRCRAVAVNNISDTSRTDTGKGTWGAIQFTLFDGSRGANPLDWCVRSVDLVYEGSGTWTFETLGTPQPFERVGKYEERKASDRFTSEMLQEYCAALGIQIFDPAFYLSQGILTYESGLLPQRGELSLQEARRRLGLRS